MEDITESRKLELACRQDVNFMWLLEGEPAPDHNTIARFRTQRLADCIEDLFGQFIEKLHVLGEIAFENVFINGTKIEACANKSKSGYISKITTYECESCAGCELKPYCTKAAGNKKMEVSKAFVALRAESQANITSAQGILLRINRSIQVEGAFGVLNEDHGFRRFLLRGKKNVRTEFLLMCLGYNINKLHNKIQQDRCRQLLHQPKAV